MRNEILRQEEPSEWLTLGQASHLLGVHPATLRQWADEGAIRVFRTPGGHRRFSTSDLRDFISLGSPKNARGAQILIQAALGRTRQTLATGGLSSEQWYTTFDEEEKKGKRESGRRLLRLLTAYLSSEPEGRQALEEGRLIGREYGLDAARRGLTLAGTARAFLFFRDHLLEATFQAPRWPRSMGGRSLETHRRVSHFLNEVFLATMEGYESATDPAPAFSN